MWISRVQEGRTLVSFSLGPPTSANIHKFDSPQVQSWRMVFVEQRQDRSLCHTNKDFLCPPPSLGGGGEIDCLKNNNKTRVQTCLDAAASDSQRLRECVC